MKLKSYLFMTLQEIIRASGLTQVQVAAAINADQPKVSKILNGKFDEFSIERITEYILHLGYDLHIGATPCPPARKHGRVVMEKRRRVGSK